MGRRGGKNRTKPTQWDYYRGYGATNFWQSSFDNNAVYRYYIDIITKMAINRFRWINLPKTCDARYLEWTLVTQGIATIAFPRKMRGTFMSLQCQQSGQPNMYDRPKAWIARGNEGTNFGCDLRNGVVVYDNNTRYPLMSGIMQYANELTHVRITRRQNRMHQMMPFILTGPQEKKQDMCNLYKQVAGGEPAVLANDSISAINIDALNTGVQYLAEEFVSDETNLWQRIYTMLGIENSSFKQERQTEDEIRAQQSPATLVRLSCLQERRYACDFLNDNFSEYLDGEIDCVWNQDNDSENFNIFHNAKSQMEMEV
jgi:hypothetical protein